MNFIDNKNVNLNELAAFRANETEEVVRLSVTTFKNPIFARLAFLKSIGREITGYKVTTEKNGHKTLVLMAGEIGFDSFHGNFQVACVIEDLQKIGLKELVQAVA